MTKNILDSRFLSDGRPPRKVHVVVPWHNESQFDQFCKAWKLDREGCVLEDSSVRVVFSPQRDNDKAGCAMTKNTGIERAICAGADVVVVIDDDCLPCSAMFQSDPLLSFALRHLEALEPQDVEMFQAVTTPPSRGTPFMRENRMMKMHVAASMGFWENVGDYDAPSQLVYGAQHPMQFRHEPIYGRYFPLCGMNLAFDVRWYPWCKFLNVPRFDDIWQGFLWQRRAYSELWCFNLGGPSVFHSRQSNVWTNLRDEAVNAELNETLWRRIAESRCLEYDELKREVGIREL